MNAKVSHALGSRTHPLVLLGTNIKTYWKLTSREAQDPCSYPPAEAGPSFYTWGGGRNLFVMT